MSLDVVEAPERTLPASQPQPGVARVRRIALADGLVMLLPALAAAAALAVRWLIPSRRLAPLSDTWPAWQHPYPMLLNMVLGLAILVVLLQRFWRPMQWIVRYYSPLIAGAILLLAGWDFVTSKRNWLMQPFFPDPDEVLTGLLADRALLLNSLQHSLVLLFAGYATGVLVGFFSGVVIGWFAVGRYWGMPILMLVGPIPATALVIVAMTLTTSAFVGGVFLLAYAVWFPMTMLTASGIANIRVSYLDVARTLGAGRWYLIVHVAIPAALPHVFLGLFVGLLTSFLTLPVAESNGVQAGLGWYIPWQKSYAEYGKVFGALMIMSLLYSTLLTLLFRVRSWVLKWQKGMLKW